jgi:hypothetical protein
MNTPIKNLPAIAAVIVGLAISTSGTASAATPEGKGASLLMPAAKIQPAHTQTVTGSIKAVHDSCSLCRDVPVVVVDRISKGSKHEERSTVMSHQCPACETKITIVGHGKAKTDKAVHTCKADGGKVKSCCGTEPGQKPVSSRTARQHS